MRSINKTQFYRHACKFYRLCLSFSIFLFNLSVLLEYQNNKTLVSELFHSTSRAQHFAGFISAVRRVLFLTEHTGGAHSATWAELNGLWSKGLIKRRHTTCPLALHFVHRGFVGKKMRARFPTRTGDLQWTTGEKTWNNGNKRCGLKNCAVRRLGLLSRSQREVFITHSAHFWNTPTAYWFRKYPLFCILNVILNIKLTQINCPVNNR